MLPTLIMESMYGLQEVALLICPMLAFLGLVFGSAKRRSYTLFVLTLVYRAGCEVRAALNQIIRRKQLPRFACQVQQAQFEYSISGYSYKPNLQEYGVFGDWLNFGLTLNWEPRRWRFDADGVPLGDYDGTIAYNPVTVTNYALSMYGKYIRGDLPAKERFFVAANRLQSMQDVKGALRYPFAWRYYLTGETYAPGWVSGMAQGMALSVFGRAYHLTNDKGYLDFGDRAFDFLVTGIADGGVMGTLADLDPRLSDRIIFEEYPAKPAGYTLNGFMYALLGVYDWSQVSEKRRHLAAEYFHRGIETLKDILPYYDMDGFSAYDLGHITYKKAPRIGVKYHAVHIVLLHALSSLTRDTQLERYEAKWASYVPQ